MINFYTCILPTWPERIISYDIFLQKITVFVGDPIDFSQMLETHRKQKSNAVSTLTIKCALFF